MTKEEKIKEEWIKAIGIDLWSFINDFAYLTVNGYIDGESESLNYIRKLLYSQNNIDIIIIDEIQFIRPKTLQGIDDNNGWIKIESEKDLPKNDGEYWILTKSKQIIHAYFEVGDIRFTQNGKDIYRGLPTHYKKVKKPKPPIY